MHSDYSSLYNLLLLHSNTSFTNQPYWCALMVAAVHLVLVSPGLWCCAWGLASSDIADSESVLYFISRAPRYIYILREREREQTELKKKDRQSKSRKKDQKIQGEVQLNEDNRRKAQNIYINKYKWKEYEQLKDSIT